MLRTRPHTYTRARARTHARKHLRIRTCRVLSRIRLLMMSQGPRLAIFGQTCNHFSPQYNFETAGLLATKLGIALGIHPEKQARMVRPRPSASVAALAPLQRREDCENTFLCN
jgi:hypothetical protein